MYTVLTYNICMRAKLKLKERAIELRKQGKTYSEIRSLVPVAKSTLGLWFIDVGMGKHQKQRITQKRIDAQKRGAARRREQRLEMTRSIFELCGKDIDSISGRELWLIGIVLYWAEGSKAKDWNISQVVQFTNSDPIMIKLYIKWLMESLHFPKDDLLLSLSIHENNKYRLSEVISFWHKQTGFQWDISDRVYFKRHKPNPGRHNLGDKYYGTLRVTVRRSVNLNRKISGWVRALCEVCGIV